MGLKKLIKKEEKTNNKTEVMEEKKLSEDEKERMFNAIVRGEDYTEVIETSRGKFEVKFPRMKDLEKIGRLVAARTGGFPVESIEKGIYMVMNMTASLDVLIISGPAWYENAKIENKTFSWGDIPDQNFLQEVYEEVFRFRKETQKLFERNSDSSDSAMATGINTKNSDGTDLFNGLSGEA